VKDLRKELRALNLDASGKKKVLAQRLRAALGPEKVDIHAYMHNSYPQSYRRTYTHTYIPWWCTVLLSFVKFACSISLCLDRLLKSSTLRTMCKLRWEN